MYARHVTYHAEPGNRERVMDIVEGVMMPAIRQEIGFIDILLLIDESNNEYVGVSRWQTRGDAEAATTSIMPLIMDDLATVLDNPPVVRIYEVHDSATYRVTRSPSGG